MAEHWMVPDWMRSTIGLLPDQLDGRFDQCVIALAVAITTDPPDVRDYDRAGVQEAPNLDPGTYGPMMLQAQNIAAAVALSECLKASHFSVTHEYHETRGAGGDCQEGERRRAEALLQQHFDVIRNFIDLMVTYAGYELAMQHERLEPESEDGHTRLSIQALHKAIELWTRNARKDVSLRVNTEQPDTGEQSR